MELNFETTQANTKHFWAFVVDTSRPKSGRRRTAAPKRNLQRYCITACSRQAKAFGVKAGMRYSQAKTLVPDMRVIVCNR